MYTSYIQKGVATLRAMSSIPTIYDVNNYYVYI